MFSFSDARRVYKGGVGRATLDLPGGANLGRRTLLLLQQGLPPFEPVPCPLAPNPGGDGQSGSCDHERSERNEKLARTAGGVPCEKSQSAECSGRHSYIQRTVVDEKGDAETDDTLDETGRANLSVSSV